MERRVLPRIASILVLAVAGASISAEALAQTSPADKRARAEELNKEAAADMKAGSYASACPKLRQVVELVPSGIGAKLSLAACYEQWGRLASASKAYRLAEQDASAAHDPREKEAHERAIALESKAATLTLIVSKAIQTLPELVITCDGEEIKLAAWNKPVLIDKGSHIVRATAAGKQTWTREIEIDLDGNRVRIPISELRDVVPAKLALPFNPGETRALPAPST